MLTAAKSSLATLTKSYIVPSYGELIPSSLNLDPSTPTAPQPCRDDTRSTDNTTIERRITTTLYKYSSFPDGK